MPIDLKADAQSGNSATMTEQSKADENEGRWDDRLKKVVKVKPKPEKPE